MEKSEIAAILQGFPQLNFKDAFVKTCANVIDHLPRSAGPTFARDISERYLAGFHSSDGASPFDE